MPNRFPGSVITVMREGTRSLLIEVQVLADAALSANPRRVAVGIDGNRLTMLLAVAHRHAGLQLQGQDVFANVVGRSALGGDCRRFGHRDGRAVELAGPAVPNSLIAFGELGWRARFARCRSARSACARRRNTASNQRWFPRRTCRSGSRRE